MFEDGRCPISRALLEDCQRIRALRRLPRISSKDTEVAEYQNKAPLPAVVLAAGAGHRYGGDKLLAQYRGRPLLQWTLKKWDDHPLVSSVVLVVQPDASEVIQIGSHFAKVTPIENPLWAKGIGTSLAAGIRKTAGYGVLVGLADTPFFEDSTLEKVVPSSGDETRIRVPVYQGVPGHPKYFPNWCFEELQSLTGDEGAKSVIRRYPKESRELMCDDPGILKDFDTPADFEKGRD